ncbi:MAG: rod shape-determining protein MreB, rod shape-determining protein MreB-related protein [Patescibacteria group bacterium]|jgi:rod shape-determining protein MreB|nr:rod shape-determining protein MreB, rod shape-determining protein MreB-related protein [Patescibacteria group bacterium]
MFSKRIAIDLGTTNTIVCVPKKGIISNEPSVVAIQASDNRIMAIGTEAHNMLGRTPESIIAAHPLRDGVIANYKITESMLRYYIAKAMGSVRLVRPEVIVAIPSGVTSTERRAVIDATTAAGAKAAYVIKGSIAAALGAGLQIASPSGNMIIDIGGGTTEIAVIALGDTVAVNSVRIGGNKFDQAIASYIRKKYNLIIGEQTAEEVKIQIGTAMPLKKELSMEVSGSNAISGLPESILIHSTDTTLALKALLGDVMNAVKVVLQNTPPELSSDVMDKGIILTGGASQLRKLDELFTKVTGVPCQVTEDPSMCVARGATMAVEHLDAFKRSVLWAK